MAIIDDKGRLFGKINLLDFIVLLFIFSVVIPGFYFGWKIYRQPKIVEVQIDWEAKYKEALVGCEQRRVTDLEGWQKRYEEVRAQRYEELITQRDKVIIEKNKVVEEKGELQKKIDNFLKEHKRAKKYFKDIK